MVVTLRSIAKELNISTAAVSKALNDKDDIGIELKQKVREVAEKLNYMPNDFAKKLATNKSYTIGVFILGRENLNFQEHFGFKFLNGIIEEANKNGYDILLFSSKNSKKYSQISREKRIEGLVFIGMRLDDEYIEDIKNIKIPVSIIDLHIKGENTSYISSDNEKGVRMAIDYLIGLKHKEIAIIGAYEESEVGETRYKEYERYMKGKNIFKKEFVFRGDFTKKSGYEKGLKIADMKNRPSAVFAISDLMALGAIEAFQEKGIKVPEDISVIGFDNIIEGNFTNPKLTTIGQNALEIGKQALKAILEKINNNKPIESILIEPELVERESCKKNKI